jgi:hypothetical protein
MEEIGGWKVLFNDCLGWGYLLFFFLICLVHDFDLSFCEDDIGRRVYT